MNEAVAEPKRKAKRSKKPAPQGQKTKQATRRVAKSKPFNWKLAFGVFAILGVMTFLFSPNDPNSFKGQPEQVSESAFQGLAGK